MRRRDFLAALSVAPLLQAKATNTPIGRSRFSFITDEAATSPEDAIAFAHKYRLQWVELRDVPGGKKGHYYKQSEEDQKAAAKQFHENGLKVSFFNTPFLKITLPGTEPLHRKPETPEQREKRIAAHQAEFDRRLDDLRQGIRAAHLLGVDHIRVFTFQRIQEPESAFQRIAEILGEMSVIAEKEKIHLLVENEGSCNVATTPELAAMMKLLPKSVGLNWDPHNAFPFHEIAYPDAYKVLPIDRTRNVQVKGKSLLEPDQKFDWAGIFHSLDHDGYRGEIGLETHYFDGTRIEKSHLSMQEMLRITESAS